MTSVLVTGSAGFVGSRLLTYLDSEGFNVIGVDTDEHDGVPATIDTYNCDLTENVELPDSDVIVHLAAHSQVQPVVEHPRRAVENLEMTEVVLSEAERMGASVINISSRDVYGNSILPSESDISLDCTNPYAASKLGAEALANSFRQTAGLEVSTLRLSNVYGPGDRNLRVIPIFIALAADGFELTVYGSNKLIDFVHVNDVCDAIHSAIQRRGIIDGEAINVGYGRGTPLSNVADQIAATVEPCPGWKVSSDRTGDVSQFVADISKANALLGYTATIDLTDGLDDTIEWYLNNPTILETIRNRL